MPRPNKEYSAGTVTRRRPMMSSTATDLYRNRGTTRMNADANAAPLFSAMPRSSRQRSSSNNTMSEKMVEDDKGRCNGEKGKEGDESPEIEIRSWIEKRRDDDECMILDGDPDKPVSFESCTDSAIDEDHDLLIVGAKGQAACRDFPHARHLCGSYNFATTPHKEHCLQCYCYVCDSIAPCRYWGTGLNLSDHCNATSELFNFKNERMIRRLKEELNII